MADGAFGVSELDWDAAKRLLADAAHGADDAELFIEDSKSESFAWDDGRLKAASYDASQGFGLRVVSGETVGYGHASTLRPRPSPAPLNPPPPPSAGPRPIWMPRPPAPTTSSIATWTPSPRRPSPTRPTFLPRLTRT